ncbi:hypothetical protein [Acetivibrio clariflavus]|uniref:Uncharacterized protein n=1 Tax=Acetivibrio clariflavus (strain DSM 19732 / NBRC 101661 / EBR45) TaxID=720554 RepID=G8LWX6_ACECE|nr:hypothetical protein [Acetivibrio clariflavus]AEV67628.1 hypothetical protein Clocl_0950 [Acetivibrio clariflavus DSM 19732]
MSTITVRACTMFTAKFMGIFIFAIKVGKRIRKGTLKRGNSNWVSLTGCLKNLNLFIKYNMTREVMEWHKGLL